MKIFSQLPLDIIKYILIFDEHFIIRNGKLISIIQKKDYRYDLLHYITLTDCNKKLNIRKSSYLHTYNLYHLPNLYNSIERRERIIQNDSFGVRIDYN
jgi:hypothetical protein